MTILEFRPKEPEKLLDWWPISLGVNGDGMVEIVRVHDKPRDPGMDDALLHVLESASLLVRADLSHDETQDDDKSAIAIFWVYESSRVRTWTLTKAWEGCGPEHAAWLRRQLDHAVAQLVDDYGLDKTPDSNDEENFEKPVDSAE